MLKVVLITCAVIAITAAAENCGQIQNGNIDDKNFALPWSVHLREKMSNDFFCMGTLISNRHVLVAARCLWPKPYFKTLKVISNIYAMIGNERFDLMDVRIHEDWKFNKDKFDADIAVVTLFNPTTAQPICVPPHNSGNLIRPNGVVAGISGVDLYHVRQRVTVEKNDECFQAFPPNFKGASPRTFCARWPGENLALSADSSGAYYYDTDATYFIQGIGSESFVQRNQCEIGKHSVFTNVAHYIDWIQKIVKRDNEKTWKDIELKCTFARNYDGLYGCEVENLNINSPNVRIASISGGHQERSTNADVEYVWIRNSRTPYLPRFDAGIFFPNLLKYLVTNSGLKVVERDDFSGMPKLETLSLENNEIETIPEDALYDLDDLVDLFVENNKIKSLPEKLLSKAPMFQRFRASNNSIEVLPAEFFKHNYALKIMSLDNNKLQKIFVDFRPFRNLKKIDLQSNQCVDTNYNDWRKFKTVVVVQKEIELTCQ